MKRRLVFLHACILLAVGLVGCGKPAAPSAATPAPSAPPASVATPTPAPTATPLPADYDSAVDFGGQTALLTAVRYALSEPREDVTYRMLDTVETLTLSDASGMTDVRILARASNLRSLVIVDGAMDLSPLAALPSLTSLTVTGGHFGDLNNVAVLPQLTTLNLFGYDTTDFSPLKKLPKLVTLRIGNHAPCDFSQLSALVQLTTLLIPDMRGGDLTWLSRLTELRDLTIWQCKQRYFDFLPSLAKLTHLTLDMRTDCDLTPIGMLVNLESLTIDMESGRAMDDQSWLPNLTGLTELTLRGLYFNLSRLTGLDKLASLTLDGIHDTLRLYELPDLPSLTALTVCNNSVVSASELVRYPNLRALAFYNSPVDNPSAVYDLVELTSLVMRPNPEGGSRSLGGVERVSGLVNLVSLDWGGRGGKLASLAALTKLTSLRIENARIVDWTPLTELTGLQSLDLSGNRLKRIPDSVQNMTALTDLDLSNCKNLRSVAPLVAAPALTRLTVSKERILDLDALSGRAGLTRLTFVSGGRYDPETRRHTGKLAFDPALVARLSETSPYVNTAESARVIERFYLTDYMHAPYYCSAAWYPAFADGE